MNVFIKVLDQIKNQLKYAHLFKIAKLNKAVYYHICYTDYCKYYFKLISYYQENANRLISNNRLLTPVKNYNVYCKLLLTLKNTQPLFNCNDFVDASEDELHGRYLIDMLNMSLGINDMYLCMDKEAITNIKLLTSVVQYYLKQVPEHILKSAKMYFSYEYIILPELNILIKFMYGYNVLYVNYNKLIMDDKLNENLLKYITNPELLTIINAFLNINRDFLAITLKDKK